MLATNKMDFDSKKQLITLFLLKLSIEIDVVILIDLNKPKETEFGYIIVYYNRNWKIHLWNNTDQTIQNDKQANNNGSNIAATKSTLVKILRSTNKPNKHKADVTCDFVPFSIFFIKTKSMKSTKSIYIDLVGASATFALSYSFARLNLLEAAPNGLPCSSIKSEKVRQRFKLKGQPNLKSINPKKC